VPHPVEEASPGVGCGLGREREGRGGRSCGARGSCWPEAELNPPPVARGSSRGGRSPSTPSTCS